MMLLLSLIFYLHYEAPPEEQNFSMILDMIRAGDVMEEDNRHMCEEMTGLPVLACIARGDKTIRGLEAEKLAALFD